MVLKLKCLLASVLFITFVVNPVFAESGADVNTDGGNVNIISSNLDTGDALDGIKKVATKGIRIARKSAKLIRRLIDRVTRPVRKILRRLKRGVLRLTKKLIRERKHFNKIKQQILDVTNLGREASQQLIQEAGASAEKIFRMQQEIVMHKLEIDQIRARER